MASSSLDGLQAVSPARVHRRAGAHRGRHGNPVLVARRTGRKRRRGRRGSDRVGRVSLRGDAGPRVLGDRRGTPAFRPCSQTRPPGRPGSHSPAREQRAAALITCRVLVVALDRASRRGKARFRRNARLANNFRFICLDTPPPWYTSFTSCYMFLGIGSPELRPGRRGAAEW